METKPPTEQSRRGLIGWILGGGFTASVLSFLYPVLRFLNPPSVPEATVNQVSAGRTQDLKVNSGKIIKFGRRPVLLIRLTDTEWKAFDGVCTHLNCTVQYETAQRQIWCACHNGLYDLTGKVISGPPPRPLPEYAVHIRGDEIFVLRNA